MIYCFSATGNSRHVADKLGALLNETIQDITKKTEIDLTQRIIFVFPCFFWGVPERVRTLLKKTPFAKEHTVYFVGTCGGFLGTTDRLVQSFIRPARALCYQLVMQTNYILRHQVDTENKLERKLQKADNQLPGIAAAIRESKGLYKSSPLLWPFTHITYSLYDKQRYTRPFVVTDRCVSCGLCAKNCPDNAITMQGKPKWNKEQCQLCLKCLHACPKNAIEYGDSTRGKRRYLYPHAK